MTGRCAYLVTRLNRVAKATRCRVETAHHAFCLTWPQDLTRLFESSQRRQEPFPDPVLAHSLRLTDTRWTLLADEGEVQRVEICCTAQPLPSGSSKKTNPTLSNGWGVGRGLTPIV